ncbi:hypothetical protein [Methanohalophilus sp.]
MDRTRMCPERKERVCGRVSRKTKTFRPDKPGRFYFPNEGDRRGEKVILIGLEDMIKRK